MAFLNKMNPKKISTKELFFTLEKNLKKHLKKKASKTFNRFGVVLSVQDGIILASGLQNVGLTELVSFKKNLKGMVSTLERDYARICLMGSETAVKPGDIIARTKKFITVPVGYALLGRVVNSLGVPIDGKGPLRKPYVSTKIKNLRKSLAILARRKELSTFQYTKMLFDRVSHKKKIKSKTKGKKKAKTKKTAAVKTKSELKMKPKIKGKKKTRKKNGKKSGKKSR